jgi:hypothetical protein
MNAFPFWVLKAMSIAMSAGARSIGIRGGAVLVSKKKP